MEACTLSKDYAHEYAPSVGAVQAQKDRTDLVTSSFHVQPLAIWALA